MTSKTPHRDLEIGTLAGRILPLIPQHPTKAFPAAVARLIRPGGYPGAELENDVGAAMRMLEQMEYVTSEKVTHPEPGKHVRVKMHKLTPRGAFAVALGQST